MAKKTKTAEAPKEQVAAPTPRLQERYEKEIRPQLAKKLGRDNRAGAAAAGKDRDQHGRGQRDHGEEAHGRRDRRLDADQRAEAAGDQEPQGDRQLPAAREPGDRLQGHAPRRRGCTSFWIGLISLALPRVRDFRGLNPNAFDGHGNYSLGLSEQLVFPELNPDKFTRPQGMNVTIVIAGTSSDDEARELLRGFGMPFKAEEAEAGKSPAA